MANHARAWREPPRGGVSDVPACATANVPACQRYWAPSSVTLVVRGVVACGLAFCSPRRSGAGTGQPTGRHHDDRTKSETLDTGDWECGGSERRTQLGRGWREADGRDGPICCCRGPMGIAADKISSFDAQTPRTLQAAQDGAAVSQNGCSVKLLLPPAPNRPASLPGSSRLVSTPNAGTLTSVGQAPICELPLHSCASSFCSLGKRTINILA